MVRGLAYAYPDGRQALFGVDLDVSPGERLAILGPNGAGKTTLVLHLNGILGTDAGPGTSQGSVHVGDVLVARQNLRQVRQRVGLVFQDPDDQLFMPTVRQDVGFGPANLGLTGDELDARVTQALAQVDMAGFEDRAPYHLSFGQRRRVAVATVLAMHPDVVVLDEPSSNLDPAARRELADVLLALDVTVVMVTHDLPYALQLCPRSVVLSAGVVVADGPTHDLLCDERADGGAPARAAVRLRPAFDRCAFPGAGRAGGRVDRLPPVTDTTKAPPDTRTSQQIEDDLIVTRARLAGRLDDLQAYVAPRAVLGRQLERVRSFYVDEFGGVRPERIAATAAVVVALVALRIRRGRSRR